MEEKSNVVFNIRVDFYNLLDINVKSFETDDEIIAQEKINEYIKKGKDFKYFTIYVEIFDTDRNRLLKKSIDYIYKEE